MQLEHSTLVQLDFDAMIHVLFQHMKGLDLLNLFRVSKVFNTKLELISADGNAWKYKIEEENYTLLPDLCTNWKRIYYLIHSNQLTNIYPGNVVDIRNRVLVANAIASFKIIGFSGNSQSPDKYQAYRSICKTNDVELAKIFYEHGFNPSQACINDAYRAQSDDMCAYLLSIVNQPSYLNIILNNACKNKRLYLVKELLKLPGTNINVNYGYEHEYPQDISILSESSEIIEAVFTHHSAKHEY